MKKNQASQSTFSVIHPLPCTPKSEPTDNNELLTEAQNNISKSIHKDYCDNEQNTNMDQEQINNSNMNQFVNRHEKLSTALKNESSYEDIEFSSFDTHEEEETNENLTIINNTNSKQNTLNSDESKSESTNVNQTLVDCLGDKKVSNNVNDVNVVRCEDGTIVKQEHDACDITIAETPNILELASPKKEEGNKSNIVSDNVAAASAAEIISTVTQTSNSCK